MLKDHSPLSSPNSSPLSLISRSPIPIYPLASMSAPTTPGSADSVTNAMSSLVQQLNIGEDDDFQYPRRNSNYITDIDSEIDTGYADDSWPVYVDSGNFQSAYSNPYMLESTVRENGVLIKPDIYVDDFAMTANECFDHSDDNLEWEDGIRRWVNR
ncbi:dystrobrevin beta [Caerostris extrusa]|uniref:Dystrobrevin beta n=1 Tax=Caerostris extrusa TaxID=172846 RepID=A0AAV4PAQ8_CAEEX|nr:dystrobrevin beta [Caerostris extrusa]